MNNKKIKILSIILAVLFAATVIDDIGKLFNSNGVQIITTIVDLLAALFGIFYVLVGCTKKNGARFFTVFMILQALIYFLLILFSRPLPEWHGVMMMLVKFVCLCLLAFAKDLGKKKSYIIALIYVAMGVFSMCVRLDSLSFIYIATRIENLLFSVSTLLMVAAKYVDKDERGTK